MKKSNTSSIHVRTTESIGYEVVIYDTEYGVRVMNGPHMLVVIV